MIKALWFVAVISSLFTIDAITTGYALVHRGGHELNGVLRALFERFGFRVVLIIIKLVALYVCVTWAVPMSDGVKAALVILYGGVVAWNTWQIR